MILELFASVFALISVFCARKQNILVFAFGILSTIIYTFIFWQEQLWGNMLINVYYTCFSIYGWYFWSRKDTEGQTVKISYTTILEWLLCIAIFLISLIFIIFVYYFSNTLSNHWSIYIDILTTALFFSGMLLMARKKIENWLMWIIGDALLIFVCVYKELYFTSILYTFLTIIAIEAYFTWKKQYQTNRF